MEPRLNPITVSDALTGKLCENELKACMP